MKTLVAIIILCGLSLSINASGSFPANNVDTNYMVKATNNPAAKLKGLAGPKK